MAKRQKKSKPDNRLNYGEVSRKLKSGGPARLYLLYGREDYLREAFLGELKALCLPEGVEMCMAGDNVDMKVELITPIAIEKGLRFAIREGGRTVGSGVVIDIEE